MTRKQALYAAIQVLEDKEVIEKLNEIIGDMPLTGWSERTIFDTIDQFIIDNGRAPTATDFKKKGLPPHPVIKLRFGINLKEFLNKYYPRKRLCSSTPYSHKTKEQWLEHFLIDYEKQKPRSAEEYNKHREEQTPTWATIARMYNISTWLEWIKFCDVKRYTLYTYSRNSNLTIIKNIDLFVGKEEFAAEFM
jgi:hypothetical protein